MNIVSKIKLYAETETTLVKLLKWIVVLIMETCVEFETIAFLWIINPRGKYLKPLYFVHNRMVQGGFELIWQCVRLSE